MYLRSGISLLNNFRMEVSVLVWWDLFIHMNSHFTCSAVAGQKDTAGLRPVFSFIWMILHNANMIYKRVTVFNWMSCFTDDWRYFLFWRFYFYSNSLTANDRNRRKSMQYSSWDSALKLDSKCALYWYPSALPVELGTNLKQICIVIIN